MPRSNARIPCRHFHRAFTRLASLASPSTRAAFAGLALLAGATAPSRALAFDNSIPAGGPILERAQGLEPPRGAPPAVPSPAPAAAPSTEPSRLPGESEVSSEQRKKKARMEALQKKIAENNARLAAVRKKRDDELKQQVEALKNAPR